MGVIWLMVIVLAVLQGVAEFLPISSSGHLRLLAALFGVDGPQTFLDIMLHVGTLVAVVTVYHSRFAAMTRAVFGALSHPASLSTRWHQDGDLRLFVWACVATIPTGAIALTLGDRFEALAAGIGWVGAALVVNGFILLLLRALTIGRFSQRTSNAAGVPGAAPRRDLEAMGLKDALLIGTAQGFGIFRGISRSGSTITVGILGGLTQEAAAAFSFIISVPAILGALALKTREADLSGDLLLLSLVGAAIAAVVGIFALKLLLRMLGRGQLHIFAWYCFALGALAIGYAIL